MSGLSIGKRNLVEKIITQNWRVSAPEQKAYSYNELLFIIQELLTDEGKKYFEGGKEIRTTPYVVFKDFTKYLLFRNLANFDSLVLITAEKGIGKSSAAIMLAREWCSLLGIQFVPEKHIAYNNDEMMAKIENLPKFHPIIADEAVRFATAEDWAKKENKTLKKKLAQVRTKHLLYILCFPLKIYKLEKNYLESFCNYWCLTGDTKIEVLFKSGEKKIVSMKTLEGRNDFKVLSFDNYNNKFEYKKTKGCIQTGVSEVYEIELENGKKIKATEDHLFLTEAGWKKLKNLTEDDKIIYYTRECKICKKEFIPHVYNNIICSEKCAIIDDNERKKKDRKVNPEKYRDADKKWYNNNFEKKNEKKKKYYIKNKDKIIEKNKKYYLLNKKKVAIRNKKIYEKNKNKFLKQKKEYYIKNVETIKQKNKAYTIKRLNTDINYRLSFNLRRRVVLALHGISKSAKTLELIGCSIKKLKIYLERKFTKKMSWSNYGKYWVIDHIIPCCNFNLRNIQEQRRCFHYTNLQPLWWKDNLEKGAKIDWNKD